MGQRRKSAAKCLLFWWAVVLLACLSGNAHAQSLNPNTPSPIRNNILEGKIAARDLGDARLTDHYYMFTGVPGDLIITVNAHNLNGDIDVFTVGTLRPLLKLTLYAESTSPVTKGIYLRRRQDLMLRVEARSPNDDEGTYHLSFSGSFEAMAGGPEAGEGEAATAPSTASATSGTKKTRRVSSVGARIEEPVTEVAAAPTPEPTPVPTPEAASTPESKPAEAESKEKAESGTPTAVTARTSRGRRPASRRTSPATSPKSQESATEKTEVPAKVEPATPEGAVSESETKPTAPTRTKRPGPRTAKATTPTATPEPAPETGPRLIIETNDGTMINRSMSGVKRVMVENGQVVVVGKDGKIDRFLLANVVRMSIAP